MNDLYAPMQIGAASESRQKIGMDAKLGPALVFFSCCFNFFLCFINTKHWITVSNAQIIVIQVAVLAVAILGVYKNINEVFLKRSALVIGGVLILKMFNPELDLKILYDIALAPIFMMLGAASSIQSTNRLVQILLFIVVAVGLTEMLFQDWFFSVFDVWSYYTSKGVLDPTMTNYNSTNTMLNGDRVIGGGRNMLSAVFGPHRSSSIFLEPVAMGNFAIICLTWLLSVRPRSRWSGLLCFGAVALCVVLPDSRFAATGCLIMLALRVTSVRNSSAVMLVLPMLALVGLVLYGLTYDMPIKGPEILDDTFSGRLLFSGRLIDFWGWPEWFGLARSSVYLDDTGYAYIINGVGLPLAVLLWVWYVMRALPCVEAFTMRAMASAYMVTSLCVGESMFSIKSAALAWFLVGAVDNCRRQADMRLMGGAENMSLPLVSRF